VKLLIYLFNLAKGTFTLGVRSVVSKWNSSKDILKCIPMILTNTNLNTKFEHIYYDAILVSFRITYMAKFSMPSAPIIEMGGQRRKYKSGE